MEIIQAAHPLDCISLLNVPSKKKCTHSQRRMLISKKKKKGFFSEWREISERLGIIFSTPDNTSLQQQHNLIQLDEREREEESGFGFGFTALHFREWNARKRFLLCHSTYCCWDDLLIGHVTEDYSWVHEHIVQILILCILYNRLFCFSFHWKTQNRKAWKNRRQ